MEIKPREALEPSALALEFPAGTLYLNKVDQKWYLAPHQEALPTSSQPIKPGRLAPPLDLAGWTDGQARGLNDFHGNVVVLDFWGMWCGGCVREIPQMKKMQERYKDQGVVFVAIHTAGADVNKVLAFQRAEEWKTLMAVDRGDKAAGSTVTKYGVVGFPGIIVVGRDGRVTFNPEANQAETWGTSAKRAAKALSIPWPRSEEVPQEQAEREQQRIMEYLLCEAIDRAIGKQ